MKHTKEYVSHKHVVENPTNYPNEDLELSKTFVRAYNQALNTPPVSGSTACCEVVKALIQSTPSSFGKIEIDKETAFRAVHHVGYSGELIEKYYH